MLDHWTAGEVLQVILDLTLFFHPGPAYSQPEARGILPQPESALVRSKPTASHLIPKQGQSGRYRVSYSSKGKPAWGSPAARRVEQAWRRSRECLPTENRRTPELAVRPWGADWRHSASSMRQVSPQHLLSLPPASAPVDLAAAPLAAGQLGQGNVKTRWPCSVPCSFFSWCIRARTRCPGNPGTRVCLWKLLPLIKQLKREDLRAIGGAGTGCAQSPWSGMGTEPRGQPHRATQPGSEGGRGGAGGGGLLKSAPLTPGAPPACA